MRTVLYVVGIGTLVTASACSNAAASKRPPQSSTATSSTATSSTASPPTTAVSPSGTGSTVAQGNGQTCATQDLRLELASSQGAGGTNYAAYNLTNTGASACVLDGYPTVKVLDQNGAVLGVATPNSGLVLGSVPGVRSVTVAPGGKTEFKMTFIENFPNGICKQDTYGSSISVVPPGSTAALTLQQREGTRELSVGPIEPVS